MIELGAIRKRWKTLQGSNPDREEDKGNAHLLLATCVCEDSEAKEKMESGPRKLGKDATRKDVGEVVDDQNDNDNEPEWSDPDDYDDPKYAQARRILSYPRSLSWKICCQIEGGCSLAIVKQLLVVPK
ncbi:hypothetical protein RHMOL_Rhmol07G0306200 [Rhododendron molle]|uniref:Uncharacterized protein n=1 Tax=Rhododendron molle TaxID=49168 RepID=A0ACC0N698_RHOML|nr:hypothetical protein RHMOL_Rhmol07G0306200 [Rhododendron molle]